MKAPSFWQKKNFLSYLLLPFSFIWYIGTLLRNLQKTYHNKKCFVICVGNINIGGAGKTPTVIALYKHMLKAINNKKLNLNIAVLCKTYKVNSVEPTFVYSYHTPSDVGDEPFMISKYCKTIVAKNRKKALEFSESQNIDIAIMDDGLQNPTFVKNYNILVVNGLVGLGNNFLLPAGSLRESCYSVSKKIQAIISYDNGIDVFCKHAKISDNINIIDGRFDIISELNTTKTYIAFCGIANPAKFESTLKNNNIQIKKLITFPDHHKYSQHDIEKLINIAKKNNLKLLTTEKDYVKIPKMYQKQIYVLKIEAHLKGLEKLIDDIIENIEKKNAN